MIDITLCARVCDLSQCQKCLRNPKRHNLKDEYQSWSDPIIVKNPKTGALECMSFVVYKKTFGGRW